MPGTLAGTPVELRAYPAESRTNARFREFDLRRLDVVYLPESLWPLADGESTPAGAFVEDDNRGAVSRAPVATIDGAPFYLSVKGIGSSVEPFSSRTLDRTAAAELTDDPDLLERLRRPPPDRDPRLITGELWLRGSPYGGQGEEHAATALRISERADLTSIEGFQIAPVVKVCALPSALADRLRRLYWYRQYRGRMVQELRLVPSNVRIYFHARQTIGSGVGAVFDQFGVASPAAAIAFETNFVRTAVPMLTLFARTLAPAPGGDRFTGLDFHDVWLDKDAVVAPDGRIFFVDLEGVDDVTVDRAEVREKVEDQIYRSLYEFVFAFEQIEAERARRFGGAGDRRDHFARIVAEALRDDPYVRLRSDAGRWEMVVRNRCAEENLYVAFRLIDR
ncbi:MAG TPA: hypothetical protein VML53_00030 [Thermoplasmata archaeon]|nr:hypothetical protein [Thermoplasmata archaeon]